MLVFAYRGVQSMNISAINTINNNISCKGFFSVSKIKKKYIPEENCKIIDAERYYFPCADETLDDLNKVTENNEKYNVAKHSDNSTYKFYSTVKIGEILPFTQAEYEVYKAANLSDGKMSSKESLIHSALLKHNLRAYINETAEIAKHSQIADILKEIFMRLIVS